MNKFSTLNSFEQRKQELRRQLQAEEQAICQCAHQITESVRSPFTSGLLSKERTTTNIGGLLGGALLGFRIYKGIQKIAKRFS